MYILELNYISIYEIHTKLFIIFSVEQIYLPNKFIIYSVYFKCQSTTIKSIVTLRLCSKITYNTCMYCDFVYSFIIYFDKFFNYIRLFLVWKFFFFFVTVCRLSMSIFISLLFVDLGT